MAITAVRGMSLMRAHYLKPGHNVLRRYLKGNKPNDDADCFEWFGCAKTKKLAKAKMKKIEKTKNKLEIVEFKTPKEDI